jgi:large subunit ribosomal protein L30
VATLEITQTSSLIGAKANQRATVRSLGLRRLHHTVTQPDRPEIRGMVAKVSHLVSVRYAGSEDVVELEPGQEPKGEGVPAAAHAIPDDEVAALREAEAEALAVPGSADPGSVVQHAPGLTSTDAPDAPEPASDPSDAVRNIGVESSSDLPHAITDPEPTPSSRARAIVDAAEAEVRAEDTGPDDEALADPRGDLDEAVASGDLPAEEAERFTEET